MRLRLFFLFFSPSFCFSLTEVCPIDRQPTNTGRTERRLRGTVYDPDGRAVPRAASVC